MKTTAQILQEIQGQSIPLETARERLEMLNFCTPRRDCADPVKRMKAEQGHREIEAYETYISGLEGR